MRTKALLISLALAILLVASQVAGAGGDDRPAGSAAATDPASDAPGLHRDFSLKPCRERFAQFHVGSAFQGHALTAHVRTCTAPEPERTVAAGGGIDPDSRGRSNFESWIYGTCEARPDEGCAPPLEIQSWPACERSPADYNAGPPGAAGQIQPKETLQLRGLPARLYEDASLELNAAEVTVVIFGHSREQLVAAAEALRTSADSPITVEPEQKLPLPAPGAENGTLSC